MSVPEYNIRRQDESGVLLSGSSFDLKYKTRVQVTGSVKQSSLLQYDINYDYEQFYTRGPWLTMVFIVPNSIIGCALTCFSSKNSTIILL